LVVLLGPTASGKSALGIWLAERLGGEVVVCDSTQVYRHFHIGTAKVPRPEQRGVPHHMIDLLEPHQVFTAGDYRRRAIQVLGDLRARRVLPILTVGTGLYLRALLEGLADAPARSEELRGRLRARASKRGTPYLHRILVRLDPETAARIAPADEPKIIRAIEVCLLAGKPLSEVHRAGRPRLEGYRAIKLGLNPPRPALYLRIERRVNAMLDAGWMEEVQRLVAQGVPADAKPFQFIGYGELRHHLQTRSPLSKVFSAITQATRRYAKRQVTWFRKEPDVLWLAGFGDEPAIAAQALGYLEQQLGAHQASRAARPGAV
jgi:tRNA dimethylallyltransferase